MTTNKKQEIEWVGDPIANWSIALRDARADGDVQQVETLLNSELVPGPRIPEIEGGRFPAVDARRVVQFAMEDSIADIVKYHGFDEFEPTVIDRLSWAMANYMEGLCNHIRMHRHNIHQVRNRCNWLHAGMVTLLRVGRFTVKPKRGLIGIVHWYDEKYRKAAMEQEASAKRWLERKYAGGDGGDFVESDDEEKEETKEMKEEEKEVSVKDGEDVRDEANKEEVKMDEVDDRMEGGRIEKEGENVKDEEETEMNEEKEKGEKEEDFDFMLLEKEFADMAVDPDYEEIRRVEEMKRQKKEADERREKRKKEEMEQKELVDRMNKEWEERERMLVERARNARCSRQLRECFAEMKEWFSPIPRVVKKGKWEDEAEGQEVAAGEPVKNEDVKYSRGDLLRSLQFIEQKHARECQEIREQQQLLYMAANGRLQQEQLQLLNYLQQERDSVDEYHTRMTEYIQAMIMEMGDQDEEEEDLLQYEQLQPMQHVQQQQQLQRRPPSLVAPTPPARRTMKRMGGNIVEEEFYDDEYIEYAEEEEVGEEGEDEEEEEEEEEEDEDVEGEGEEALEMVAYCPDEDMEEDEEEEENEEAFELVGHDSDDSLDYYEESDEEEPSKEQ